MSTIQVNKIENTSGVEQYTAKAWVNFDSTGTVAIRADGNVSSLVDYAVGQFGYNLQNLAPDANGSSVGGYSQSINVDSFGFYGTAVSTSSLVRLSAYNGMFVDPPYFHGVLIR